MKHLISITGAGPGNPDLLTIKAYKRLSEADIVLYDALPGEEILNIAPPAARLIYVGKTANDGQNQSSRQQAINRLMLKLALQEKKIVRLKGGDPMIFGRGAEEIQFCKNNGLNYEVIPGVSAAMAASAEFEVPLTERDKSTMALIYTATLSNNRFSNLNCVIEVLNTGSSVSVYMGLSKLPQLLTELVKSGVDAKTHVNILSNVSHSNKAILSGNLLNIAGLLKKHKPTTPAVIIIGKYAGRITCQHTEHAYSEHSMAITKETFVFAGAR